MDRTNILTLKINTMEYQLSDKEQMEMDDAFESLSTYHKQCKQKNNRLMRAVKSVLGEGFHDEVMALFEDNEVGGGIWYVEPHQIVADCPVEDNECDAEDFNHIQDYRVDQWSVGDSGDSWSGYIYVKLKENKWLKAAFSM